MPLVTMKEVLLPAQKSGYAVPAFNVCNVEFAQAALKAAEVCRSPVILAIHPVERDYCGIDVITAFVRVMAERAGVPVVIHLDHGATLKDIVTAIRYGFTSVMIDASSKQLEENIKITRNIAETAHDAGVSVEAELGTVGNNEGTGAAYAVKASQMTDPQTAAAFADETGVDSLAVAIGTAHGVYVETPFIDMDRLREIRRRVNIPLVLHGASGISDPVIREAVNHGITKINIATDLKQAFHAGIRAYMNNHPEVFEPRDIFPHGTEAAVALAMKKIRLFGSEGKG